MANSKAPVAFYDNNNITNGNFNVSEIENIEPWCLELKSSDLVYSSNYHDTPLRHFVAAIFLFLLILNVVGNSIVIVVVLIDRRLRRITSGLIISMAAADIMVGLTVELHGVILLLRQNNIKVNSTLCELSVSGDIYFSLCELLHLVCLALERYLVICHPFKYERCGKKFLSFIIAMAWTIPFCLSFLPILFLWHKVGQDDLYSCLDSLHIDVCVFFPNITYSSILFVVMFLLPTILLLYCHTKILKVALIHRRKIGTQTTLGTYYSSVDALNTQSVIPDAHANNTSTRPSQQNGRPSSANLDAVTINFKHELAPFLELAETNNHVSGSSSVNSDQRLTDLNSPDSYRPIATIEKLVHHLSENEKSTNTPKCVIFRAVCGIYDFRASRSIICVCICFIMTWTPYWTLMLIAPIIGPLNIPKEVVLAALWMFSLGTAINPFVYYFSNTTVRRGILRVGKRLIKHMRCNNTEQR